MQGSSIATSRRSAATVAFTRKSSRRSECVSDLSGTLWLGIADSAREERLIIRSLQKSAPEVRLGTLAGGSRSASVELDGRQPEARALAVRVGLQRLCGTEATAGYRCVLTAETCVAISLG